MPDRPFEVTACRRPSCPFRRADTEAIARRIETLIERSGLPDWIRAGDPAFIPPHRRLRVAVAGCPNQCPQPQIKEIGLVARAEPLVTSEGCTLCGACVEVCPDGAIEIEDGGPRIDPERCLACGLCASACPSGTLVTDYGRGRRTGWTLLVGGRLGRRPRLARTVAEGLSDDEAVEALRGIIERLEEALEAGSVDPDERLSDLLDRLTGNSEGGREA